MEELKYITSVQNPMVKYVLALKDKSRERRNAGRFVVEGLKEIQMALKGHYVLDTVFFHPEFFPLQRVKELLGKETQGTALVEVSKEVYQRMAYRETTEGVLAIGQCKQHTLEDLGFKKGAPLILVAESPEKPGNIGALLRTADAANLDAVIIADPKGDLYNPNVIRSSIGCVFTNQVAMATTQEVISFLKKKGMAIYCAALSAPKKYTTVDYSAPTAIVVGTEATGLSRPWLENATANIIIPMEGEIDSMNVSVSAAIVIFEAKRQRDPSFHEG
ncbi:MAG: RNA methyltransferase [Sediminicola sp.]|tara:strand:- start:45987 stop:46811 length:825 start_codon:yes stop_codon:yes gene_type:complete